MNELRIALFSAENSHFSIIIWRFEEIVNEYEQDERKDECRVNFDKIFEQFYLVCIVVRNNCGKAAILVERHGVGSDFI